MRAASSNVHDMNAPASTVVSSLIDAPREAVYRAFLDPAAVATWLPPGSMTGVIHTFEPREGGTIRMSLVYPAEAPLVARQDLRAHRHVSRPLPGAGPEAANRVGDAIRTGGPVLCRRDDRELDLRERRQRHQDHRTLREHSARNPTRGQSGRLALDALATRPIPRRMTDCRHRRC